MENKQKTAVDLFLGEIIPLTINCVPSIDLFECWKKAKAKEKEQMDNVAGEFWNEGASYMYDGGRKYESFEQYYKETYE